MLHRTRSVLLERPLPHNVYFALSTLGCGVFDFENHQRMRAIIIGAGRGRRLMPTTADTPKCYAAVQGRRLLDWGLKAFGEAGIKDYCFIGGYQIEKVRSDYPQFTFRHNKDWENNNILLSLMYAEDVMDEGFMCCYSDILFTPGVVTRVLNHEGDIVLSVDTRWLDRYQHRTLHPPDDAEKVMTQNGHVTRIHRGIPTAEAYGEYTGIAKFTAAGAKRLRDHFHRARKQYAGKPFREAVSFEKAYLIHLFQQMIEDRVVIAHADTPGEYMEVDTQQDFELAQQFWPAA
jgi:choline kinase